MAKQLKQFIVGLLLLGLFLSSVVYFLLDTALNSVIEQTIEKRGTVLLGTEVTVEKVKLSTFAGKGRVEGFKIASPEGYPAPHALSVDHMQVQVDAETLREKKVIINRLHIQSPHVIFVQGLTSNNLQEILKNIHEATSGPEPDEGALSIRFAVRELIIDEGRVGLGIVGEQVGVPLGSIHAENLGFEGEGLTGPQLAEEILTRILQPSLAAVATGAAREGLRHAGNAIDGLLNGGKAKPKED